MTLEVNVRLLAERVADAMDAAIGASHAAADACDSFVLIITASPDAAPRKFTTVGCCTSVFVTGRVRNNVLKAGFGCHKCFNMAIRWEL